MATTKQLTEPNVLRDPKQAVLPIDAISRYITPNNKAPTNKRHERYRDIAMTDANGRIAAGAQLLAAAIQKQMEHSHAPSGTKSLRLFKPKEASEILGIADSTIRQMHLHGKVPEPQNTDGRGREYTLGEINALRDAYSESIRAPKNFKKRRSNSEPLKVISFINFKGGSGKTTSAIHTAQYLALHGYRVLAVDTDPQASLTSYFGYRPEVDFFNSNTLYDAIDYEQDVHMRDVIRKTYFTGLDLAPASLFLAEFEHQTPIALSRGTGTPFYDVMRQNLDSVSDDYDVVIIDCPPQLGYLAIASMCASTGLIITVVPNMLDVMSMSQFLQMCASTIEIVEQAGGALKFDFVKYLLNRNLPSDSPQQQVVGFLRQIFGEDVMTDTLLQSTAISDAGLSNKTVLESNKSEFNRETILRALASVNGVGNEIEGYLAKGWGRS